MQKNIASSLCSYHYDPLDRLSRSQSSDQASIGRFYNKSRLATEIQGLNRHSIFQHGDQLLAQHSIYGKATDTTLLTTDMQRSVLAEVSGKTRQTAAYTAYGHTQPSNGLLSLLGFNGERPDPVTEHYLLGNGYRTLNPVLMRFNSPDSLSPFEKGGINAYAYVNGDPINQVDPSGHSKWSIIKKLLSPKIDFPRPMEDIHNRWDMIETIGNSSRSTRENANTLLNSYLNTLEPMHKGFPDTLVGMSAEVIWRNPTIKLGAEFKNIEDQVLTPIYQRQRLATTLDQYTRDAPYNLGTFAHSLNRHNGLNDSSVSNVLQSILTHTQQYAGRKPCPRKNVISKITTHESKKNPQ